MLFRILGAAFAGFAAQTWKALPLRSVCWLRGVRWLPPVAARTFESLPLRGAHWFRALRSTARAFESLPLRGAHKI